MSFRDPTYVRVEDLELQVVFSRSAWLEPRHGSSERGAYYLFLRGFPGAGEGRTADEATEDPARELRLWVEHHDEEHEGYPFTPHSDQPELVDLVRRLLAVGSLSEALRTALPAAAPSGRGRSPRRGRR